MSGTDICYDAMVIHSCYAMSGTDIRYAGTVLWCYGAMVLRVRYAMSGTDIRYGATSPVSETMLRFKPEGQRPFLLICCEIKRKDPPLQYSLYQKCGRLCLISQRNQAQIVAFPVQFGAEMRSIVFDFAVEGCCLWRLRSSDH
eukprot:3940632-Rhodomonas_salina.1